MACRKQVVIGVLMAVPLWLASCAQHSPGEDAATTVAAGTSDTASTAAAVPAPIAAHTPAAGEPTPQSAAASSRVFIDPATGEQRAPTAAEAAVQAAQSKAAGTASIRQKLPVEEIPVPGGFTEVRIGDRVMREEKVCLRPDGSLTACADQP